MISWECPDNKKLKPQIKTKNNPIFTRPSRQWKLPPNPPPTISMGCTSLSNQVLVLQVCDISNFVFHSKQADCPIGKILALPPPSATSDFQQPREHFNCTAEGKSCELSHKFNLFFGMLLPMPLRAHLVRCLSGLFTKKKGKREEKRREEKRRGKRYFSRNIWVFGA